MTKYAELCDYSDASSFSSTDVATCFQFCLLIFGRVRAKDLALKYNANLYRGKNATTLRAGLAAGTSRKKGKRKKGKTDVDIQNSVEHHNLLKDHIANCGDEFHEDSDCHKKILTDETDADEIDD